jgi:C4-dicarboxylate-specific signal transduction histidine kinase
MGELTASIAHEINQPLAALVMNANACLRWLAAETPNLDEAPRHGATNRPRWTTRLGGYRAHSGAARQGAANATTIEHQ